MNIGQIQNIIKNGETIEVEFKQSFQSTQDIARIIAAFANTLGGILLLGIRDNGQIEGIHDNSDIFQQKIAHAITCIHPSPLTTIELHTIETKKILSVIVHKANTTVFHSVEGVIYIRLGSTIQRLEGQSIVDFLRNRQILLFEEAVEFSATLNDIDENRIKIYLQKRNQTEYLQNHSIQDFFLSKKLTSFQPDIKLKNAAILFFAKDPQYFFPYLKIKLIRFNGNEPVEVLAYEEANGSLPQMIEQAYNFVQRFISRTFIIQNTTRRDLSVLPDDAVREAIINSVAHRDYFNKNEIQLSIFDDRLEITNPGGLPEGMTQDLLGALSIQRNPTIYQFLKDYGYMEGIGSGISKIFKQMQERHLQKPKFVISKEFFRIILSMKTHEVQHPERDFNPRQLKALEYLKIHTKIQSHNYASYNKVSIPTAIKDLTDLVNKGVLKKVGSYKGAYYILFNKDVE